MFENIHGGVEIVFDELARTCLIVSAGENAGISGRVDDSIDSGKIFKVGRITRIGVAHGNTGRF